LIELLVVIAVLGILAAMLLPVLSRAKQRAQGTLCLNNGKHMMTAMILYSGDNHEFFPPNPDDGNTSPGYDWCPGNAGIGQSAEFNPDILLDPHLSLLIGYLSGNASVFKCPADSRQGIYQGTNPAFIGKVIPAARTFSMNHAVGTIDPGYDQTGRGGPHSGIPNLSVNGEWLDSNYTNRRDSPWRTFGKTTDIRAPGPSRLWVLVDEDANSLNDAAFAVGMEIPAWIDFPGIYHNGSCNFSFADGHSETHRWQYRAEKAKGDITEPQDYQDWLWMRDRTSANVSGVMPPLP
jgi:prepilin-type processing-associated H-X9-DG protein